MNRPVSSPRTLLTQALDLVHAGQFVGAEARAREVLRADPRNAEAQYVLGLSSLFQNRHADALAHFDLAAEADGGNAQYHFARAAALAGVERPEEAIDAYRKALALKPRFFEALANLGNVLERSERFEEALRAYEGALALRPDEVLLLNGLGASQIALGRYPEAAQTLRRAVKLRPDFAPALNNLARALWLVGAVEEPIELLKRAVALRPDFKEAWVNLGDRFYRARRDAEALECFERVLMLDPSNDEVRYRRDSMTGRTVHRAPDQYVRNFFDSFAPEFDKRLTGDLEYRAPERMAEFLGPWLSSRSGLRVADLGCGTGLSGVFVRSRSARLVGVDLSPRMLALARERAIYDELVEGELTAYLDRQPAESLDLVLAVDVFVYIGDLEPIVRGTARAMAPHGVFAFSVEDLAGTADDFRLARTGRYAHSGAYVHRIAAASGLRSMDERAVVLRKEEGEPVAGVIYAFEKPD